MLRLATVDPASAGEHQVQDKPVFVRRKRAAESSSSEEDDDVEEEEEEEAVGKVEAEEEEEEAKRPSAEVSQKKSKKSPASKPKQAKKAKKAAELQPIYEDYITESDLEGTLERLLGNYLSKVGLQDRAEPKTAEAPTRKPTAPKPAKESADRRALVQLSKSLDALHKKLTKALSDSS